jgi:radical SAM-linked protein
VVQHLVIRYAKRGRMRFASHRDVARAVERGVRKAGLPVAYSAGFSPHPRISYAGGAPTGVASEAEYLEISLTRECQPGEVRDGLDAALPDGIDVMEVREVASAAGVAGSGVQQLRLEASDWRVVLPGIAPAEAARAAAEFLARESIEVERLTSKGTRRLDARAAVVALHPEASGQPEGEAGPQVPARPDAHDGTGPGDRRRAVGGPARERAILRMVVRHLTPAVRPDDILAALRRVAGLPPSPPAVVTRLAQGPLDERGVIAPAAPGDPRPLPEDGPAHEQEETARRSGTQAAAAAGAAPASAYEQLPRGAEGPPMDPRARESDGRLPACSTSSDQANTMTEMRRPARSSPAR